jgi:peptide chain release factor 1
MQDKLASLLERFKEIENQLADPEISADFSRSQGLMREHAALKPLAELATDYRRVTSETAEMQAMIRDESDKEMIDMARSELAALDKRKAELEENLKVALLPKDPNDSKNVMMEIRAGTGGEEAALFAADLYRLYTRYSQRMGWGLEVMSLSESSPGGIKEIIVKILGDGAYSSLKHESGGHRVQRIPVTESSGRIHTSAATIAVLPEAEEIDVEMKAEDIQIDIFHASGHGGQNVQKVATAIRITHKPSGLVAICQDERSQHKNKEKAMAVLRARIYAREVERQQLEISEERKSQVGSGDRSERVRTYNFPQSRVTDHRTGLSQFNLDEVMDGDIQPFIDSLIEREQELKLEAAGI